MGAKAADPILPVTRAAPTLSQPVALLLLALLTLIWGVHWVVVKEGLRYFPPLTYSALRLAAGLVTVLMVLVARGRLRRPPREDLPVVLSVAWFQIAASVLIINLALQVVPAGRSSVLQFTMPLWVALILWLVFRVTPQRHQLLGVVLGVAGIIVLVYPSVLDLGDPSRLAGALGITMSAVLWAVVTIHVRRHSWRTTPLELLPWTLAAATVPLVLMAALLESGARVTWEPAGLAILAYSGPLATAFAFWASQSVTRSLGSLSSAVGFLLTPVVGLVAASILLGEPIGPLDLAGFALVLVGIGAAVLMDSGSQGRASRAARHTIQ